jgi:glycine reductase complex component B subunit gamma
MDRVGIPNALITGFTSIAYNVGANRIVFGGDFTSPAGDPSLPIEREKAYRYKILMKSLEALSQDVSEPTIFTVDESKEADK